MDQIKKGVVTLLQIILWLTFLVAINDTYVLLGTRAAGSLYANYAFIIDPLYWLTGYIIMPIQMLFDKIGLYHPGGPDTWFPISSQDEWNHLVTPIHLNNLLPFQGGMIWWIPLASVMVTMASTLWDYLYERGKNFFWNIIIEYVFQRKKTKLYAKALDQRNAEMQRLNNQYRTLAQETHSLKDSVITDELTKVFNKRFFLSRLQQEFETCRVEKSVLSIIMIDIDFFKKLNDSYGHLAGDKVLIQVSSVLKRFVPDQCYPCRYGGEEFSIIMPRRGVNEAIEAARLMQENTQQLRFEEIDPKLRVTISQGICTVDFACSESKGIKQFDQILQLADQELYRSKMEGRNRVSVNSLLGPKY